jgi:3'-phosphoadenosine 5'-phosphosulfate sulfotransferase (PAPS reductase)/FAD synthetase
MATEKSVRFLDIDVVTAAKRRIEYVLSAYDHVYVSFSGGKDSTAVIHLVREVMDEMGLKNFPVRLLFRDEEIIPENVIEFVQGYREKAGFELHYFAYPMKSHIFMMGEHWPYIQWDTSRKWLRQKPAYAITQIHPDASRPIDQHETNALTMAHLGVKGKIAILNGIRADESLTRFRSCVLKKGEHNYIMGDPGGAKNIDFIKPIYDWSQTDIFKYFHDRSIEYAPIYNMQMYSGESYRVATPLHDRAYSTLVRLRETYPLFYSQILDLWPEIATHERYWSAVDRWGVINDYPKSWEGIFRYIDEKIDSANNKAMAIKAVRGVREMKEKNRRLGRYSKGGCYGFPLLTVFRALVGGSYMKGIQSNPFPGPVEMAYEDAANAEANGASVVSFKIDSEDENETAADA